MSVGSTRVLVIDDDADLRELIHDSLERDGFEVASAENGTRGLEVQRAKPAHIVITDIFMPEKEGIETLVALRSEFPRAKIIVMSGGAGTTKTDYLSLARELGAAKSFRKPFELRALSAAVRELVRSA